MTPDRHTEAMPSTVPGRTTITARALQHLAIGLVRDAAHVAPRDITVALADERGALKVSVAVPVALAAGRSETLVERGAELRNELIVGMQNLAGRSVGVVDVRYSGVRRIEQRRVT